MTLTRGKRIGFALIAMAISVAGGLVLLLAADLVVHHRAERSAGLNRRGYRGPVVPRKQPGELRVVMVGGSTVFGYGVKPTESIPAALEKKLRERITRPVSVVNLGFNNEGAYAFKPNLEDFAYLDYDVIVLYEGYNDLPGDESPNRAVYRRSSAIYRYTGYYPILPLYLQEKAQSLEYGDLNVAYEELRKKEAGRADKVVFRPSLATRTSSVALQAISSMTMALDGQLSNAATLLPKGANATVSTVGCVSPYISYCESVAAAVRYGLSRGNGVVVGSQPRAIGDGPSHERHEKQQVMLGQMIARVFGDEPRVSWADFARLVDLHSTDVTFDGMHLKPEANATVAAALVDPVLTAAAAAHR